MISMVKQVALAPWRVKISYPNDMKKLEKFMQKSRVHVGLATCYHPGPERQDLFLAIITPSGKFDMTRSYGGPPQNGIPFAINTAIDFLRRSLPG